MQRIDKYNRMGETRNVFKKIGDIKGSFYARMSTIKIEMLRSSQKQKRLRRGGKNAQTIYIRKSE